MVVRIRSEDQLSVRHTRRLKRALKRMLSGLYPGLDLEVSVLLVCEREIERLNATYLHREGPTDVISFPQLSTEEIDQLRHGDLRSAETLGDIVICVPVARGQAAERGETLPEEMVLLAAHGLLHLAGYDHDTNERAAEMAAAERRMVGRSIIE
ncbi:MAG TPA: rRNA maturation RNase YbeY [Candidatus Anoxymicrobiaceae bacterium]